MAHKTPPSMPSELSRRAFVGASLAAAAAGVTASASAQSPAAASGSAAQPPAPSFAANPPKGFTPMAAPGLVIKVSKANTLQPNQLWPTEEAARAMLPRAMAELTGQQDLGKAFARFVHPHDKVAIKLNGIGAQKGALMGTNKELVLEIVRGVLAAGVPATNVWVFEQYPSFLLGTRVKESDLPAGVRALTHNNQMAGTPNIRVHGIDTRFARQLIDATAVINVALIKDHSLCGTTGALKNMTHGCTMNPQSFHTNLMDPQIPLLYAQEAIRSRVRLNIIDGFKVMYSGGPLGKDRQAIVPHDSVYVSTDPVAVDVVGWKVIEKWRADKGLPSFAKLKREPSYLMRAADMGLGIADLNQIRLKESAA